MTLNHFHLDICSYNISGISNYYNDVAGKTEQQYEKTEYDQGRKGRTGKPKHNKTSSGHGQQFAVGVA